MQEAVKYQIDLAEKTGNPLKNGDVLLTNHPSCGGLVSKSLLQNFNVKLDGYFHPNVNRKSSTRLDRYNARVL